MTDVPKRYDITKDEMVPVTQEWVDEVTGVINSFGRARHAAKQFLDAWVPNLEQKK